MSSQSVVAPKPFNIPNIHQILQQQQQQHHFQSWKDVVDQRLVSTAESVIKNDKIQEDKIRDLETKLNSELVKSRQIHSLLSETLQNLNFNRQLIDKAVQSHIPYINKEIKDSMDTLLNLEEKLPIIHSQVKAVRRVYDSGRATAQQLATELQWKQASLSEKCRRIILTRTTPISTTDAFLIRLLFLLVFILFVWQFSTALDGVYRAYRHRLVWGDKLIS